MAVTASAVSGFSGDGPVAESVVHRPPPHLRPFVESAVGYRYEGFPPGIHRGLPSRHLTVVLSLSDPVDTSWADGGEHSSLFALAGGLHAAPVTIHHDGNQHGIQLQLTPFGARRLFGMPAADLAWTVVPLEEVLAPGRDLAARLRDLPSWGERFRALDEVLTASLDAASRRDPRPEVAFAFERLVRSAGLLDVTSLAREVGWRRRHLAQQFRKEYGLSPKVLARVLRFERARWMLTSPRRPRLADVAAMCGFADQAHMTRDWLALAGASPTAWLADEQFPFVQDDEDDSGAEWSP
ncbi:MAG TPA: helix-turn-helix domain-containing protein [Acidimicrobiales bacterium]